MLHAANASSQGYKRIRIVANDTDFIVLGISFFAEIGAEKLWVSFGAGKKLRYIPIHHICNTMSPAKARALPAFHTLTGCDNTSFFPGTGKKSSYKSGKLGQILPLHCMPSDGKASHTLLRGY